jgi:zinc D-Ala-D-Ala dipeptidase
MNWRAGLARAQELLLAVIAVVVTIAGQAFAQSTLPAGFVYLRDIDPSISQDIRYAGYDNFVGHPLPGYEAAECILRRETAAALKRVQTDLAASGLRLKVYDCYRPARTVRAMAQWVHDGTPAGSSKRFFPRLQKSGLFALGYIAAHSQHSTGIAVDLTLVMASRSPAAAFDGKAAYGACTGPATQRSPDDSVDMGTGYDCFDAASHTASGAVGTEQQRWRKVLLEAMRRQGFANYHREWWHYSYARAGRWPAYDFAIRSP